MANMSIRAGGAPSQAADLVSADQETVVGAGTAANPLRASSTRTFQVVMDPSDGTVTGMVVSPGTNGSALTADRGLADDVQDSIVLGIVVEGAAQSQIGRVQSAGIVTLTTAQWDAGAGTTGGLTTGAIYYVSDTVPGNLTTTPPAFVTQVGFALSPTELQLQPSSPQP